MKTMGFFLMVFCPLLVLAQGNVITQNDSSSLYEIELDFSKVELSINSEAMKYADRFHEAYNKPYRIIRVEKTHRLKPGYPKAWPEKVESFIQYRPAEKTIKFWQEINLPTSIEMTGCCLIFMVIGLIIVPFFNDDLVPPFIAIFFIIFAICAIIGALIMKFPFTFVFIVLSFVSMAVTSEMSDRDNQEEQVKFYIAWIINVLLLGAAITFFILGK